MKVIRSLVLPACLFLGCFLHADDQLSPWGVSSSSSGMGGVREWMPRMHDVGIASARMFPEWGSIEPHKGEWTWEKADALVRTADDHQFQITGLLMGAVPWSRDKPHTFPMADLDDWSAFVEQSVARYKGRIRCWEVWNEGNGGFNGGHHTATDYGRLAAAAYLAVKKANPAAQAGLSTASFDPDYLRHAILAQRAAGLPASFDYLCIHPYEIADGVNRPDGEVPYLWMAHLLRDALKESAPGKANADIWITEVGRNVAQRKDQAAAEREAAAALEKLYVMGIAQGIRCLQWFEAQDPAGEEPGFGLLKRDGSPRASYHALKSMIAMLGPAPKYLGWLALGDGGRGYGFVFQRDTTPVLAAWKTAGDSDQHLVFDRAVQTTPVTEEGAQMLAAGQQFSLGTEPVFVTGLPPSLVAQAVANKDKDFPWGGDFSRAKAVSVQLGERIPCTGVVQTGERTSPSTLFPDGTKGILMSANQGASFYVHPSFASIDTREYFVRITVRRVTPGNVGMNLLYERADTQGGVPVRNAGTWFGLSNEEGWQTFVWHIKDACFAKMWGYDFSFRPEQSQPFAIGRVEVSTVPF